MYNTLNSIDTCMNISPAIILSVAGTLVAIISSKTSHSKKTPQEKNKKLNKILAAYLLVVLIFVFPNWINISSKIKSKLTSGQTSQTIALNDIEDKYDENGLLLNGTIGLYFDDYPNFVKYDYESQRFYTLKYNRIPTAYNRLNIKFIFKHNNEIVKSTNDIVYSIMVCSPEQFYTYDEHVEIPVGNLIFTASEDFYTIYCQSGIYCFIVESSDSKRYYSDEYYINSNNELTVYLYEPY